ncbi:MAG: UDP-glucose/GDP-mannose dehydrogenase family protein [Bacteroidales bacterium]
MQIIIVGTGYVGLVTGTCFADVGINVTCVDIDKKKIENLKNGISPIYEPGLDEIIEHNVAKGRLHFSTDLASCLNDADVVFIAVGTPPDEDGSADLKYVLSAASEIGLHMNKYMLVVTKSTVPVGTAKKVREAIQKELDKRGSSLEFDVASNPEFLKEGAAIDDFIRPDRIVIGVESAKAEDIMNRLYKPFVMNGHPVIFMDIPSAEMTKYAANSMLATKISFMNDVANLCEITGANINMVRKGIGSDSRIGTKFIYPGIGYGGSCFPKDVRALIQTAAENGYNMRVLKAADGVNNDQKLVLFNKFKKYFNGDLQGKLVAIWGLSFKPQTDDMREAPSLVIIKKLLEAGCKVIAYDPVAMHETQRRIGDSIAYAKDPYDALKNADCLLIATEWTEFRLPDLALMKKLMKNPAVFDGRNIYNSEEMKAEGFDYFCIGIKS